jgi:hypothetical protein
LIAPNLPTKDASLVDSSCEVSMTTDAVWATTLIALGRFLAEAKRTTLPRKCTLALCLPRVDYAAVLFAIGIIKHSYQGEPVPDQLGRLRKLKGAWVSFVEAGRTGVGRLEQVPDDVDGQCKILHYKKRLPNFDCMTAEERKRYVPPKSGGLWTLLRADRWSSIKPAGRDFDSERGARADQVVRATTQSARIQAFNRYFSADFGDDILSSRSCNLCIYGNATRIHSEIFETLIPNEDLRLAEILRPDSQPEYATSAHCTVASEASITPKAGSIVIFEARRRLADQLAATEDCDRTVLLGRNSPNYAESAQLVMDAYALRHADDPPQPDFTCPMSIKYLLFYHR